MRSIYADRFCKHNILARLLLQQRYANLRGFTGTKRLTRIKLVSLK